ncbi:hypothetical protein [Oscillatoria sp. FACHB-1406]|uniref:hypothetical protein n=1 Tax=Oscillatoria sp. FACHB-1406 TaxID=2692846 RepID=UPI001687E746|nr:hypothetical protein [Oscillatoria sp. FACHB-1406]MBD2578876.1 hypothetical protein [Oscillatoria sp. FACHB-1406]
MSTCPCCNQQMFLSAGKNRFYWYCSSCRQEMPDLISVMMTARQRAKRTRVFESLESTPQVVGAR